MPCGALGEAGDVGIGEDVGVFGEVGKPACVVRVHIWTLEIWISGQIQVQNPVQVYAGSRALPSFEAETI